MRKMVSAACAAIISFALLLFTLEIAARRRYTMRLTAAFLSPMAYLDDGLSNRRIKFITLAPDIINR